MLDEYIIAFSAAVIVAAVVILASFLSRYGKLVEEADESTRLAKDVWDSVNSRFSVIDARIIDLMAKTEVLMSRAGTAGPRSSPEVRPAPVATVDTLVRSPAELNSRMPTSVIASGEGTETEKRVLRFLAEGSRDSAQIRQDVGRSREHTARLMKSLFDRGLVTRNDRNKPYVYEITDEGRSYLAS